MRLIHTGDWHLGKTLMHNSLLEDQDYLLNGEFLKLADELNPDAIIIAGDIYDRGVPPVDAVNLFDEIIFKLNEKKIPILCISGNHDSASRLNFAGRILARENFFIITKPEKNPSPIVLRDEFGEVYFSLVPYFEPPAIREKFFHDEPERRLTGDEAIKIYLTESRKKIPDGKRSVAVAHLFAAGGITSESERTFVGGAENIGAENFSAYTYTALGHLHKPQNMAKSNGYFVRYSGSPLKYSFDEATHEKGITFVEMDGDGKISAENIKLTPRRDVRIVEGTVDELCDGERSDDYIFANITNENHVLYAADRLRENVFPNLAGIKFTNLEREPENFSEISAPKENTSMLEHFADFFKYETQEELTGDYRKAMENFLREIERRESF